jgi:hypothetical protein
LRDGLLPLTTALTAAFLALTAAGIVVGDVRASRAPSERTSMFSWELGGPNASLLGAGVAILGLAAVLKAGGGFALGRELALVVSFKQEEVLGSGETLAVGEEDATPGDDFWKKETMDRCLADDEAPVGRLAAPPLAGVRAALLPALSPAMLLAGAGEARDAGEGQ